MKVGNRVRYIRNDNEVDKIAGWYPPIGTLGKVIGIDGNDILVKWDNGTISDGEWWCDLKDVEEVELKSNSFCDSEVKNSTIKSDYTEIAKKLWIYICVIDDEKRTYEELADAIRLSDNELLLCRRLERL